MNAFYEEQRENDTQLRIIRNGNHSFQPHFHINVELLVVKRGDYCVRLNGGEHRVKDGCLLLCDSYDIHAYERLSKEENEDDCILIIPPRYLERFTAHRHGKRLLTPLLCDGALCERILHLIDTVLTPTESEYVTASTIDHILSLLLEKGQLTEEGEERDIALIRRILSYINLHYREALSLSSLSSALGYSEAHLSRIFHHFMKTNIKAYINRLRLSYINRRLSDNPKADVTPLIFEAGFGSIQSYYRNRNR